MNKIEDLGQVISTDVLVLGGGIAGLCAAIKAREAHADVLVLDKGGIGWAGQTPIGGGGIVHISPEQIEPWFQFTVNDGCFLNNQDWTYTFAKEIHNATMELAKYGLGFTRKNGDVEVQQVAKEEGMTIFYVTNSMLKLKSSATSRGVKTMDKIYAIDLLKRDGKVNGAIGFGLLDGKTYIFNAKAVIIAVGSCRYQHEKTFCVCTGEGPAMSYRAGAQLMNAEFGNNYTFGTPLIGIGERRIPASQMENAQGKKIMESMQGFTGLQDIKKINEIMLAEVLAGRGPIYVDMGKLTPEERARVMFNFSVRPPLIADAFRILQEKAGVNLEKDKLEIEPMLVGGQGPIRIDLNCQTTLPGLWAAGDAASLGSGWTGAKASGSRGGRGIAFGTVSGLKAGANAGELASTMERLPIDPGEAQKAKERIFAPMGRGGRLTPNDVIYQIHQSIVPLKYNFIRHGTRLKEALGIVAKAKENLSNINVRNPHELYRYHQAESMAMGADFTLGSALYREESRGAHSREDYPVTDNNNWLKWIVIKDKEGVHQRSTEEIPIEQYRLKP